MKKKSFNGIAENRSSLNFGCNLVEYDMSTHTGSYLWLVCSKVLNFANNSGLDVISMRLKPRDSVKQPAIMNNSLDGYQKLFAKNIHKF